jgi:Zn-dependent protease with chaperone function
MRIMKRAAFLLSAAIVLSAAAPKATSTALPTYTPAYEPRTVDERGLWAQADEDERQVRDSPLLIRDEALNSYVRHVLCTTVGDDRCKTARIYVLEVPAVNAFMAPNGMMVVWSGLLLRASSEAELGTVLGHEFAHFELRHGLTAFKRKRTTSDILAWASVLGGLAGVDTSLSQLSLIGSYYRFNRDQEQEADLLGLKYLGSSPYPSASAPLLWEHMMAETDATEIGRKRRPRQHYASGFFASHPTDLKRAVYLLAEAKKIGDAGDPRVAGHRQGVGKYLPLFLADQIKLNDFGGTEYILGQLAGVNGWTGDLLFARGELYRMRGNPRDLVSAASFYGDAIKAGYAAPEARRNLGLALLRGGQVTDGKAALGDYLRLKPDASDSKAIAALLSD